MNDILASTYFKNFAVPLITVFLSVFVKIVSRNDQFISFKKEDLAIGMDVSITALIIFIVASAGLASELANITSDVTNIVNERLTSVPWLILAFVCIIWFVSTIVRKFGWDNEDELNIYWGILFPDIIGILLLLFVVNWMGQ